MNLNAKEMAKFPTPVPSLGDQEQVVARLKIARPLAAELRVPRWLSPRSAFYGNRSCKELAGEL
ncbi:MAG: hypothetical protein MZU91_13010 [Desulfosudis oleivorans]|nr:hypothetical protein [Desulfosudis oleivorans]